MSEPAAPPTALGLTEIVVIDTETGGLDPLEHSLLTLALVTGQGDALLDLTIAEPVLVVTAKSLEITRLDPATITATGVAPAAACDAIDAFLDAQAPGRNWVLAGHNVTFDVGFLKRLYRLAGRELPRALGHRTVDTHTLLWALAAAGRLPADVTGSEAAFQYFGVAPPPEQRHTALGDALATRNLLEHLLTALKTPPFIDRDGPGAMGARLNR